MNKKSEQCEQKSDDLKTEEEEITAATKNALRIVTNIFNLLGDGLFPGRLSPMIYEAGRWVKETKADLEEQMKKFDEKSRTATDTPAKKSK